MVVSDSKSKVKVLLLDGDTTAIISMCTTQSVLLKHEIYLIDRIDNESRDKMRHLKCLIFVRPTADSIQSVIDELRAPKYGSYELFFSNVVKKSQLERIAESDDHELVTRVQEMFADYLVVNRDLFSLSLERPSIFGNRPDSWAEEALQRTVEGLVGLLLSLKHRPVIRHDRNSGMAKKLANELSYTMNQPEGRQLFDFRNTDTPPILLILDRRNDPVTPLLTPWTYQAMVHHILGIQNNRVDLSTVPDLPRDLTKEIVLSADQDQFFAQSMFLNFGDLGASIKDYVSHYQAKTKSSSAIESIADMKRFVEDYPEFRRLSGNVSKHVTVVNELSRRVSADSLLQVSELEQSLACNDSHNSDLKSVQQLLGLPTVPDEAKVRLVALYALRYQSHPNCATSQLIHQLPSPTENGWLVRRLVDSYAGQNLRQENLFESESFFARAQSGFTKGLKGVENVYTQHTPLLQRTLTSLIKGKLKKSTHPYYDDGNLPPWAKQDESHSERPQDIVVFTIGGVTYEEARLVAEMNATTKGVRVILGGTSILNTQSFLSNLRNAFNKWE
ncbi:hypothetical protein TRICI_004340 [Trichomonascus ciferrii]|uniref:Sec1-like protein n=1 Tax=Trichomonascus ciferrii TaxID=44093 RepID=A0A642V0X9_9ASCO|nr:hypothetical protein TRICI_004340 [Trichomonascus ciferrii]